ncbi:MAG: (2Fe-2S) ferredoxin domain-containing protein [Oscillospiraceae bacterium]|nr:(2Fe-2S) ferredoxin domain-containing protein [Oscillospiraceae bacterium]
MKSLEELKAIRDKMKGQVDVREEGSDATRIVIGMATCGIAAGARPVLTAFSNIVQERNLENVSVVQTGCVGLCQYEPIVEVYKADGEKTTYVKVKPEMAEEIIDQHIIKGNVVTKYTIETAKLG